MGRLRPQPWGGAATLGRGSVEPHGRNINQAVSGENTGEMNSGAKRRQNTQNHKPGERLGRGWAGGRGSRDSSPGCLCRRGLSAGRLVVGEGAPLGWRLRDDTRHQGHGPPSLSITEQPRGHQPCRQQSPESWCHRLLAASCPEPTGGRADTLTQQAAVKASAGLARELGL